MHALVERADLLDEVVQLHIVAVLDDLAEALAALVACQPFIEQLLHLHHFLELLVANEAEVLLLHEPIAVVRIVERWLLVLLVLLLSHLEIIHIHHVVRSRVIIEVLHH